jgi:hypothetical protein
MLCLIQCWRIRNFRNIIELETLELHVTIVTIMKACLMSKMCLRELQLKMKTP